MAYRESLIIFNHIEEDDKLRKIPQSKKQKNQFSRTTKLLFFVEELVIFAMLTAMILLMR